MEATSKTPAPHSAFPITRIMLSFCASAKLQKPGTSNTDERTHLLTQVLAFLDAGVCCLVADREFIGRDWFAFLLEHQVDFVIRLRSHTWLTLDDGRQRYGATFNAHMPRGTTRYYPQTTRYDGLTLNLRCPEPVEGVCHRPPTANASC